MRYEVKVPLTYDNLKIFKSWIFNKSSWEWEPPVEYPSDNKSYVWDEENTKWVELN